MNDFSKKLKNFILKNKKMLLFIVIFIIIFILLINFIFKLTSSNGVFKRLENGLNKEYTVKTSNGEYKIKITGVTETDDRNQFSNIKADRVIVISYTYENVSYDENGLYLFDGNFKIYDKKGNQLEKYPVATLSGETIQSGTVAYATMAYALNNESNYLKVEFYSDMYSDTFDKEFMISW